MASSHSSNGVDLEANNSIWDRKPEAKPSSRHRRAANPETEIPHQTASTMTSDVDDSNHLMMSSSMMSASITLKSVKSKKKKEKSKKKKAKKSKKNNDGVDQDDNEGGQSVTEKMAPDNTFKIEKAAATTIVVDRGPLHQRTERTERSRTTHASFPTVTTAPLTPRHSANSDTIHSPVPTSVSTGTSVSKISKSTNATGRINKLDRSSSRILKESSGEDEESTVSGLTFGTTHIDEPALLAYLMTIGIDPESAKKVANRYAEYRNDPDGSWEAFNKLKKASSKRSRKRNGEGGRMEDEGLESRLSTGRNVPRQGSRDEVSTLTDPSLQRRIASLQDPEQGERRERSRDGRRPVPRIGSRDEISTLSDPSLRRLSTSLTGTNSLQPSIQTGSNGESRDTTTNARRPRKKEPPPPISQVTVHEADVELLDDELPVHFDDQYCGEEPVVLAQSSKITLGFLMRDRNGRRFFCMSFLVVASIAAALAVIFGKREPTVPKPTAPSTTISSATLAPADDSSSFSSGVPTRAPSFSPTRILDDIVDAASTLSNLDDIMRDGSPQRRALGWLSSEEQPPLDLSSIDFQQRYVLAVFYYSTGGHNWNLRGNWLSHTLDVCDWGFQIECQGSNIVSLLALTDNNLVGTIPHELKYLGLESLRLGRNKLEGSIPSDLCTFGNFNRLSWLELPYNRLTGSIPDISGCNERLVVMNLGYNFLSGKLPLSLSASPQLFELLLPNNQLSGELSSFPLAQMADLNKFDCMWNRLTGTLPDVSQNLNYLWLDNNFLTGSIPAYLNYSLLTELTLSNNLLTGNHIQQLKQAFVLSNQLDFVDSIRISKFDFSNNLFSGDTGPRITDDPPIVVIPSLLYIDISGNDYFGTFSLGKSTFPSLEHLDMSNNKFDDWEIPEGAVLRFLDASGNQFAGIQEELFRQKELEYVDFSKNPLSEVNQLSPLIGNFRGLIQLHLRETGLAGTIPEEVGLLRRLEVLDVSSTLLGGSVPLELQDLLYLRDLSISDTSLSGIITPDTCSQVNITATGMKNCDLFCPCCSLLQNCF